MLKIASTIFGVAALAGYFISSVVVGYSPISKASNAMTAQTCPIYVFHSAHYGGWVYTSHYYCGWYWAFAGWFWVVFPVYIAGVAITKGFFTK
jgi:hypothetical protein